MRYFLSEDVFTDEEGIIHRVYGISATDSNGNKSVSYPDIFFDKKEAETFVNLCNESKLPLCHLQDVIEDMLT